MHHFVLDCLTSVLEIHSKEQIMEQELNVANSPQLFDIKVRPTFIKNSWLATNRRTIIL
jgi:hypothetical protein